MVCFAVPPILQTDPMALKSKPFRLATRGLDRHGIDLPKRQLTAKTNKNKPLPLCRFWWESPVTAPGFHADRQMGLSHQAARPKGRLWRK